MATLLRLLALLRLVRIKTTRTGQIITCSNLTIINAVLVSCGPMREDTLTMVIMGLQCLGTVLALSIRYGAAHWFYDEASRR